MSADAMIRAVEEVCLGTLGTVRTETDSLTRDAYAVMDDLTAAQRAIVNARFEVETVGEERTTSVGPSTSNRAIVAYDLRVALIFPTASEVEADLRRDVRARVLNTLGRVRKALTWPGNLTQTLAAVATGVVPGGVKCSPGRVTREDWKSRIVRAEMPIRVLVLETQAVS